MKRRKEIERVRKAQEKMDRRHGKIPKEQFETPPPESDEVLQPQPDRDGEEVLVHE